MSPRARLSRHPVAFYFVLTFAISWSGALLVAAPFLIRHEPLTAFTGVLMFPAMLMGPAFSSILLTYVLDGSVGVRALFARMSPATIPLRWSAIVLFPPAAMLAVLLLLKTFVSPAYTPNLFLLGIAFGVPAGLLEEIGWTGFAFPRMGSPSNRLVPAIALGLLWSLWHLPVINFLGAAVPHGAYWPYFFLAFAICMTAIRVLIVWAYTHTGSILLAQAIHISSTASLVIFSPHVTPVQEPGWYLLYGAALWAAVLILRFRFGKSLRR